jgi:hypothetical protein
VAKFDARRTQVAQNAVDFSRNFEGAFSQVRVLGGVLRRAKVVAPEGMSTGGGKQARQPLTLVPDQGEGPAISVGWIELPTQRAGIKTFRSLASAHQARYRGRPLDIDEASYQTFVGWVVNHLAGYGVNVTLEDEVTPSIPPPRAPAAPVQERESDVMSYAAVALLAFLFGASVGGLAVYAKFVGF